MVQQRWGQAGWRHSVAVTFGVATAAVALPVGPLADVASAAPVTISVTSTVDDGSPGTLRWALAQATAAAPGDEVTVELAEGTYELSACGAGEDAGVTGDLDVTPVGPLVLVGLGAGAEVRQTCGDDRVLDVHGSPSPAVTLRSLAVTGGSVVGDGGGVRATGNVVLDGVDAVGNTARGTAGVDGPGGAVRGGGVAADGTVTVTGGRLEGNTALGGVGADTGDGPSGGDAHGGAIAATAITVDGTAITGNTAEGGRAGWHDISSFGSGGLARGGALAAATVDVMAATVDGNTAAGGSNGGAAEGGAVWGTTVTVDGTSLVGNQARGAGGAGSLCSLDGGAARGGAVHGDTLVVHDSTFDGDVAAGGAGGTGTGSVCDDSEGGVGEGGALAAGDATITGSTFVAPTARGGGGSGTGGPAQGGAVRATGAVTMSDSTIADAVVRGGVDGSPTVILPGFPPVLLSGATAGTAVSAVGTVSLTDVNVGRAVLDGAATSEVDAEGAVTMLGSTIAGPIQRGVRSATSIAATNSSLVPSSVATTTSGGYFSLPLEGTLLFAPDVSLVHVTAIDPTTSTSTRSVRATVLSSTGSLLGGGLGFRCIGPGSTAVAATSGGGNVARDGAATCGLTAPTDHSADDPAIDDVSPVADHGGATPTVVPRSANPAIDAGGVPCAVADDQRGAARPVGAGCDAGAVEVDGVAADLGVSAVATTAGPLRPADPVAWAVEVTAAGPTAVVPVLGLVVAGGSSPTAVASDGGTCASAASVVTCTWPTAVPVGASRQVTVSSTVDGSGRSEVVLDAWVGHDGLDPAPADNRADASVAVDVVADLSVSVDPVAELVVGARRNVMVRVANAGPDVSAASPSSPLVVELAMPADVTAQPSTGCAPAGAVVRCSVTSPIASGGSFSFSVPIEAGEAFTGRDLTATLLAPTTPDPDADDREATVSLGAHRAVADLGVALSTTSSPWVRTTTTSLQLTVTNTGPDPVPAAVTATVQLPDGVRLSFRPSGWPCTFPTDPGAQVACTIGGSATSPWSGARTISMPVRIDADAADPASSTASVAAAALGDGSPSMTDPDPGDDAAGLDVPARSITADLAVTSLRLIACGAHCTPATLYTGQPRLVEVAVANAGPESATGTVIDVTGPVGVVLTPSSGACTTVVGGLRCTPPANLASGAAPSYSFFADVAPGTVGPVVLHAEVSSSTYDDDPSDNGRDLELGVVGTTDADLSLRIQRSQVGSADWVAVTLTNEGPNLAPVVPFTTTFSPGILTVGVLGTSGTPPTATCEPLTPSAGGGTQRRCTTSDPLFPGESVRVVFAITRDATPARVVSSVASATDPDPSDDVAVWWSDGVPSVDGVVRAEGTDARLGGVTVSLLEEHPSWRVVATTTTAADGSYRFVGVPAGSYRLRFFDGTGTWRRTWWSQRASYRTGDAVVVASGPATTAAQRLAPLATGAVTGRVTDGSGAALPGIWVLVFSTSDGYVGAASSGPAGGFTVRDLRPGSYVVQFVDPTRTVLARWFGGAVLAPRARVVDVQDDPVDVSIGL